MSDSSPFGFSIARGRIIHSVAESIKFFLSSIVMNLQGGDSVEAAEQEFAAYNNRKFCVVFPLARVAILAALRALGLKPGDKILMPCLTIKPILDVVVSLELQPVYIDYDEDTCFFDLERLSEVDGDIKAVLATPLFGIAPNMERLLDFCDGTGAVLIEDFSQALNCKYGERRIGTFGRVSIYSASSIKTLDTLGGGFFLTDDSDLYDAAKRFQSELSPPSRLLVIRKAGLNLLRNLATTPLGFNIVTRHFLAAQSWLSPEGELRQTGTRDATPVTKLPDSWFFRYSELQGKIALSWLDRVASADDARILCAESYRQGFPEHLLPKGEDCGRSVYWQFPIKTSRDTIKYWRKHLRSRGVDSSITSLSLISSIALYPGARPDLPIAKRVHQEYLFVPCSSKLSQNDRERVIKSIQTFGASGVE